MPASNPVYSVAPTTDDIVALAEQALAAIPGRLVQYLSGVGIAVEDMADDATLDELGIEDSWSLTGVYRGTPIGSRSYDDIVRQPDMIVLYREPILLEWIEGGEDLFRLVRNVVVHEVAHHFGFSDDEIEALESEPE